MTAGGPDRSRGRRTLATLAGRYGVQVTYETHGRAGGRVGDESLVGVLSALGVPISHRDQAPELLAAATAAAGRQTLEPVLVRRPGAPTAHTLTLPSAVAPGRVQVTLRLEDGTVSGAVSHPSWPARPGPGGSTEPT